MDTSPSPRDRDPEHAPGDAVVASPLCASWPTGVRDVGIVVGVGRCVFRRITTYDVLVGGGVRTLLSYEVDSL